MEDYGHHPSELTATITAARSGWPDRRIVTVFQPHRYSRTQALFDEFSQALADSDAVVLTDIYPAGEEAIDGVDSGALCQSIRSRGRVNPILISNVLDLPQELPSMLEDGDLVLMLGAWGLVLQLQWAGGLVLQLLLGLKALRIGVVGGCWYGYW